MRKNIIKPFKIIVPKGLKKARTLIEEDLKKIDVKKLKKQDIVIYDGLIKINDKNK